MIAKLSGVVEDIGQDEVIIDVNGVGYLVFCSSRTLSKLTKSKTAVSLFIVTHVREDHIHLYGFEDKLEKEWFNLLTTVQGVGAKVGLAILGVLSPTEIASSLMLQDKVALSQAQGVGSRLAERIISELKDKFSGIPLNSDMDYSETSTLKKVEITDAVSALVNLGYRQTDAFVAVSKVVHEFDPKVGVEELVRAALKDLSS
ncbi:MAG: Holliday junction branch migration protein RuvA [Rhodospirillaceae bacterium]|nr:Holliday junction branch migration protein RuvA [Rhodospirillaceae bacterium]|tara:strand:+ start:111 stop:716 length:606 start_codon:yes stop_codon:yes gene_type:complete